MPFSSRYGRVVETPSFLNLILTPILISQSAVAQRHADDLVQRALKMLTSVKLEMDGDGVITGAAVDMDDKDERAMLPTTYAPGGKWKERLFRGVKAIVLSESKDMVSLDWARVG